MFEVLDDAEWRMLRRRATRRRFKRGEVIFHEGDPGVALHIIDKGHVAIRQSTPAGDVLTLVVLGPGDAFGEQALLAGGLRTASAVAVESADTQSLSHADFEELRAGHPTMNVLLVDILAAQVRRLSALLLEALYVPAEDRVVRRLSEVADSYSTEGPVELPLTQEDLATMAGTSRPTVNRVLAGLKESGAVELSRGKVAVLDRHLLDERIP